jgi:hypothetical protein
MDNRASASQNEHVDDLIASYALDALDEAELVTFESHLSECETCRSELADFMIIHGGLLRLPEAVPPPSELRDELKKQIASPGVIRFPQISLGMAAAGLAFAVLIAVNGLLLNRFQNITDQADRLTEQQQIGQTALAIMSLPSSKIASIDEETVRGTFIYEPAFPLAVLYVWGLEVPNEEQAYQLWLVREDGSRESAALFRPPDDGRFAWVHVLASAPLMDFVEFGVTLEPAEGSRVPSGPRLLGARLVE